MATKVTMPKLGLTMVEGTITEWKKKEGDKVEKGEILYVLETEKISYEVEAPESGILGKIIAQVGDTLPIGGLVAYIIQPGEELPEIPEAEVPAAAEEVKAEAPPVKEAVAAAKAKESKEIKASPVARRIAEENNIDLSTITGTGPEGRIVKEDILRAVEEKKKAPVQAAPAEAPGGKGKLLPLTTTRKAIAKNMSKSFQTAPHFYENIDVDATEVKKLRQDLLPVIEKATGVRLALTDIFIKIVTKVLEEQPMFNSTWTDEGIMLLEDINIGIAADTDAGLIVPVLHNANKKSLAEIAVARADLVNRGRERKLTFDEMTGGTFTFNNIGMFNVTGGGSILNPGEAAILTLGGIMDKPVVRDGQIVIRPMMETDISIDHRILDGVSTARFLIRFKELVENPFLILS